MYAAAADHESRNPHLLYEPEIVCWPTTSSAKNNSIVDEKRSCSTKCFNSSSKNKTNASTRTRSSIKQPAPSPYYTNGTTYTHHDIYEHCTPNNTNLLLTDSAIGLTTSSSSSSSQQHSSSCSNDLFGYTFHRLNLCMKNSAKSRKALQRFKKQKKRLLKKHHHPRKRYSNRNDRHRRQRHHHRHHPQVQKYDMAVREEDGEIVRRHHMHHHRADKKNTPTISFPQEAPAPEPANAYTSRAEDYSIRATTSTAEYCKFMFSSIEPTLSNPDDNTNSISSSSSFLPTQKQVAAGSSTTASVSTANTPVIRNHDPMTKADSSLDMLVGTTTTLHAGCASSANRTASIFHNAGERLPQYHHRSSNNNQMVTTSSISGAADLEPISWSPRAAAAAANADGGVHDFTTDGVHVCAFLEKHAILSSLPRTTILSIIPLAGQNSL